MPLDFRPVDCLGDKALGLVSVAPAGERYPLAPFEVLVVREEVLDLAPRDFRQVGVVPDMCVALRQFWNWHSDNLFVAPCLVRHLEHANRARRNDGAWNDRSVLATSMSQGSPSAESVCGMKP